MIEYSFEEEHIISIPLIVGSAIKARRCKICDRIMFVNVGVHEESLDYVCKYCREQKKDVKNDTT